MRAVPARRLPSILVLLMLPAAAAVAGAQEPPPPAGPVEPAPPPAGEQPAGDADEDAGNGGDRRGDQVFPTLNVELPEGDLDLRASQLVGRIFFQGQVRYNFVDGDITAFLRYRVYGHHRTYHVTGFDEVEFGSVERLSDEFERVRGLLFLTEWPHDYHRRTTFLAEIDRIVSNKDELRFENEKTNTFVRLGYQIGTPDDTRSNAIVGETRARVDRLFTPLRAIGPYGAGLSAAVTYGFDFTGGDFEYLKVEAEALKRFELPRETALVGRLHGGTFPQKNRRVLPADGPEEPEELPEALQYEIPLDELFRLDGRDSLRGLDDTRRGTEELHTTWELFVPWFVDEQRRALGVDWNRWYWVLYGGYGTAGFDREIYTDIDSYITDLGLGFQASFRLRKYTFFLSGIVAQTLERDADVEAKLSIKTYH
jgi:hypothetical protein